MSTNTDNWATLPPEQQCIRDKCYYPTDTFIPFPRDAIEQSIPERFEKMVCRYPKRYWERLNNQRWPYGAFSYRNLHVAQLVRPACQEGCFGANGLRIVTAREE